MATASGRVRGFGVRAARRMAAALGLAVLLPAAALAQTAGSDGMIVIPGRGESAEAALSNATAHGIANPTPRGPSSLNAYSSADLRNAYGGGSAASGGAPSHDIVLSGDPNAATGVVTGGNAAMRAAATAPMAEPPLYPDNRAAMPQASPAAAQSATQSAAPNAQAGYAAGYAAGIAAARRAAAASALQTAPAAPTAPTPAPTSVKSGYQPAVYRAPAVPAPSAAARAQQVAPVVAQDAPPATNAMRYARPGILRVSAHPSAVPVSPAAPAETGAAQQAAAPVADGQQDPEAIRQAALAFLRQQTAGLPGKATVTVSPAFPRGLAACTTLEPFLPPGARLWGRTTVGVRCAGAKPWTLFLQSKITVQGTYYVAARALAPGDVLTAADLTPRDGDLTMLPLAIVTDPSQAVGGTALMRVALGLPLRQDMLRSASAVSIGQTVRVVVAGHGFSISSEGSVLNNAGPGQQVRVRMAEGQIVMGVVKDSGTVEIPL
ncbi:flagellar basal body P-ring formation chaperone FlgA [Burkholderia sp. 3C]